MRGRGPLRLLRPAVRGTQVPDVPAANGVSTSRLGLEEQATLYGQYLHALGRRMAAGYSVALRPEQYHRAGDLLIALANVAVAFGTCRAECPPIVDGPARGEPRAS